MNKINELYKAVREESRQRRASHRENSARILSEAGIPFVPKNGGAHLIVEGTTCFIDFWPGTGRWITRNGKRGFGVRNLINYVQGK